MSVHEQLLTAIGDERGAGLPTGYAKRALVCSAWTRPRFRWSSMVLAVMLTPPIEVVDNLRQSPWSFSAASTSARIAQRRTLRASASSICNTSLKTTIDSVPMMSASAFVSALKSEGLN